MNHIMAMQGFNLDEESSQKIWRYIDIDKLESLLSKKALYFSSAREFSDNFEGSITRRHYEYTLRGSKSGARIDADLYAKLIAPAFYQLTRLTKVNCWHINNSESAAMWQLYLREGKGIAIQSTIGRLSESLMPFKLDPEYSEETIRIGKVRYIDYRSDVMDDKSMLGRFFYKRRSYAYENELRAAISLRAAEEYGVAIPEKGIFVGVDLKKLLEAIYLAPAIDGAYQDKVRALIGLHDLELKLQHSELDDEALY